MGHNEKLRKELQQKKESTCVKKYLSSISRFKVLSEDELELLARASRVMHKKAGQFLARAGDEATHFFVLQKGTIGMYFIKPNGKQFTVKTFSSHALFFVSLALAHTRYSGYLEIVEDSTVVAIPSKETQQLIKSNPKFAQNMLSHVVNENLHLADIISGFLIDARARLCRYLFRHALESGKNVHGELQFELKVPKGEIAAALDISPETLSRTFSQLKRENIIDLNDNVVTIKNVRELVASSESL